MDVDRITLERGHFGWDYVIRNLRTGDTILIQSDQDYPGVARTFGWDGDDEQYEEAQQFLDEAIGKVVEDPGYFS